MAAQLLIFSWVDVLTVGLLKMSARLAVLWHLLGVPLGDSMLRLTWEGKCGRGFHTFQHISQEGVCEELGADLLIHKSQRAVSSTLRKCFWDLL